MHTTVTHKLESRRYLYPPRASTAIPRDKTSIYAQHNWLAQLKYNDSHALLDFDGQALTTIWDRHAGQLAYDWTNSPLAPALTDLGEKLSTRHGAGRHLIDGGILHTRHAAIKHVAVIWDVLILDGQHLIGTTYQERYDILQSLLPDGADRYTFKDQDLGALIAPGIILPDNIPATRWDDAWKAIDTINRGYPQPVVEGLVFRNMRGKLKPAFSERNNSDWMGRSRVTTRRHLF